jgi:sugar lactone lactonase YvrE
MNVSGDLFSPRARGQPHHALGRGDRRRQCLPQPSNLANGNTRDRQGRRITCEHGSLCFSPGESKLYIVEGGVTPRLIQAYDVVDGGAAAQGRQLA